jgi:hypothetical protein
MLRFLGAWIQRLPREFSTKYVQQIQSLHEVRGSFALYSFLLFGLAALGVYALVSRRLPRVSFLLLWCILHSCIYLLTFPTGGHGGRYQPLNLLLLFPCLFFGALWLLQKAVKEQALWTAGVAFAALALAGVSSLRTWRIVTIDGIGHINNTHGRMGEWMLKNLPADADVAAFDIGRVSYVWNRNLIDLGGLVDPSYVPYLTSDHIPQYLEEHRVQYVVLPSKAADEFGFTHDNALTMTKLSEFCSAYAPWIVGFRYTIHAMECQELYQLHFTTDTERQSYASNKRN